MLVLLRSLEMLEEKILPYFDLMFPSWIIYVGCCSGFAEILGCFVVCLTSVCVCMHARSLRGSLNPILSFVIFSS